MFTLKINFKDKSMKYFTELKIKTSVTLTTLVCHWRTSQKAKVSTLFRHSKEFAVSKLI
jgi:hypothetical protein